MGWGVHVESPPNSRRLVRLGLEDGIGDTIFEITKNKVPGFPRISLTPVGFFYDKRPVVNPRGYATTVISSKNGSTWKTNQPYEWELGNLIGTLSDRIPDAALVVLTQVPTPNPSPSSSVTRVERLRRQGIGAGFYNYVFHVTGLEALTNGDAVRQHIATAWDNYKASAAPSAPNATPSRHSR